MKTTNDFLNAVQKKHQLTSDNRLALFLGCTRQSISGYRHEKTFLDDAIAFKVAEALELDPAYVLACVHAEREKNVTLRNVWLTIAERMYAPALVLIGFCTIALCNVTYVGDSLSYAGLVGSLALSGSQTNQSIHYA